MLPCQIAPIYSLLTYVIQRVSTRIQTATPADQDLGKAAFTPNFPAFPSGHATFGSACFNTLKAFRAQRPATSGNPDAISGEFVSDELNGISVDPFTGAPRPRVPIKYTSLDKMIEDNNLSRVFLGVHWKFDATFGAEAGAEIAKKVIQKAFT